MMPRPEREALERQTRDRERAAKVLSEERMAEMKADVERKLAARYSYDQDPVWKQAHRQAEDVVREAERLITERCQQLGIPAQFAPGLSIYWHSRGENACRERRAELRRVAYAEIEALAKNAKAKITLAVCNVRDRLLVSSLGSDEAKEFLKSMPTVESLMPMFSIEEIEQKTKPRWVLE